jgi:outer membrane protein OmpA-like peptidoglycan-associated protein
MPPVIPVRSKGESVDSWVSVSDLMSGLMLLFMLIAIIFMLQVQEDKDNIDEVVQDYQAVRSDLYDDLKKEFREDLKKWDAELDRETLSVRFNEPEVLFEPGDAVLKDKFRRILDNFFPRYIGVLMGEKYQNHITEVRIEGHTSPEWLGLGHRPVKAFMLNMGLSQQRTHSVLNYLVTLPRVSMVWDHWLKHRMTANGLSSSHPIETNGQMDWARSRRVEFRVRTDAEQQIQKLVEQLNVQNRQVL